MTYFWVALGGATGAAARYGVVQWTGSRWGGTFPWGTLAVNLSGSLAIGLIITLVLGRNADPAYRFFLVTGFLGGYTTFSAFSFETFALIESRRWDTAVLYAVGSVVLGVLATGLGLVLGKLIVR